MSTGHAIDGNFFASIPANYFFWGRSELIAGAGEDQRYLDATFVTAALTLL
jgi:hypothetical protein